MRTVTIASVLGVVLNLGIAVFSLTGASWPCTVPSLTVAALCGGNWLLHRRLTRNDLERERIVDHIIDRYTERIDALNRGWLN